eukprot:3384572-Pleurochrysis_carterae.AAC.2
MYIGSTTGLQATNARDVTLEGERPGRGLDPVDLCKLSFEEEAQRWGVPGVPTSLGVDRLSGCVESLALREVGENFRVAKLKLREHRVAAT